MTREELIRENEKLKEEIADLKKENDSLKTKTESQAQRIDNLMEQLLKRNKALFGRKSEQEKYLTDGQMELPNVLNEAEAESGGVYHEPTEETIIVKAHARKKKRTKAELAQQLPVKNTMTDLAETQKFCDVCGSKLELIKRRFHSSVLKIEPERIFMERYGRSIYKCPVCEKTADKSKIVISEDPAPVPVIPKSMASASILAYIMTVKYQLGVPLYRQEQYYHRRGIALPRNTMANWLIRSAEVLRPVSEYLWVLAYEEPVLHGDETPLRVLTKNGKPLDKKAQMWVCATPENGTYRIALYFYSDSRNKETAESLYKHYKGTLVTDGMKSYGSGDYVHAGCWAHARRNFADGIPKEDKSGTSASAQALKRIDAMFRLEAEAKKKKFTEEQLLQLRQEKILPMITEFYEFIGTLKPLGGSQLFKAVGYVKNQKEKLLVFLNNPKVEMSNNIAERTVKPFVICRKNFLFCDTEKGAEASAIICTIIETANRNNLNPYEYLNYLLTVLPTFGENPTVSQIKSVMPWSLTIPSVCRNPEL